MRIILVLLGALGQLGRFAARAYLRNASFWVPATAGAIGGWLLGHFALAHGLRHGRYPLAWIPLAWSLIAGAAVGAAAKSWIDNVFGRNR